MKLTQARVTNFKSVEDSGWVSLDGVTCMVGKNESGKTAFLNALRRLNPVLGARSDFDLKDYPRKGYIRYKKAHKTEPAIVVRGIFQLSQKEISEIEDELISLGAEPITKNSEFKDDEKILAIQNQIEQVI